MSWNLAEATLADVPAITSIFAHDEPTPFMKLCLGSLNLLALNFKQADRITQSLGEPEEKWIVARDEHNKIASFAQWQLPKAQEKTEEQTEEELKAAQEAYENSITPGMNVELVVEFRDGITKLRKEVLQGRRHYLLMDLGTAKTWQRKGAATALVEWPFGAADREKVAVYLDTTSDGPARRLFEELGFEKVGGFEIDLGRYGGEGKHSHIGMIRWPGSSHVARVGVEGKVV